MVSEKFYKQVLDAIAERLVVIDKQGNIVFANKAWSDYDRAYGEGSPTDWAKQNYIEVCDRAAADGDPHGAEVAAGIRRTISGELDSFYYEYPCHTATAEFWYMMRIVASDENRFVISHHDITERKRAEQEALRLSRVDGLTGVSNRRCFDDFVQTEWKRCSRFAMPLSLALLDIDHFKLINDTYGHQVGDDSLRAVGGVLGGLAKRPTDLCARYGGEEFALIFGGTHLHESKTMISNAVARICDLKIPNQHSPIEGRLTVSVGVASISPNKNDDLHAFIGAVDALLYQAKCDGRNCVVARRLDDCEPA